MSHFLIKNATIIDGTGNESYTGSVLINDDKIEKIIRSSIKSSKKLPKARKVIDAKSKILSPGFIDIHSHNDWLFPDPDHIDLLEPLMRQGITTVVTGQCGFSPAPVFMDKTDEIGSLQDILCDKPISLHHTSMNSFFDSLAENGIAVNMAHFIGHATLKGTLTGFLSSAKLSISDLSRLEYAIDESFDAGAFGLSMGLMYPPGMYSSMQELLWFANFVSRNNSVLSVHKKALSSISQTYPYIPGGTPHNIIALKEIFAIAKRADVSLQLSHLIFVSEQSWKTEDRIFKIIEKEYQAGVDVAFDAYAYTTGNTGIIAVLPFWFVENFEKNVASRMAIRAVKLMNRVAKRLLKFDIGDITILRANYQPYEKYEGMNFHQIAKDIGIDVFDAYLNFAVMSEGKARILIGGYYDNDSPESILARVLSHPLCKFETDTIPTRKGKQNPATFGNFPKIIARFTRDSKTMTLEEAIHKMTGASARKIGIKKRGEILEGNYADLVLFDYDSIDENSEMNKPAVGIDYVFINGKPVVVKNSVERKKLYGRVLRKNDP